MFESGEEIEDKMHKFKYDIEKETGIPWKKKKSYRYLYTLACQKGVILRAFKRMKRGKSDRKDIQMVEKKRYLYQLIIRLGVIVMIYC